MFDFISFGSGSSGNCYYLYTENSKILIDVGVGIRALKKNFNDYGLRFADGFSGLLITHDHADHIKSVGSMSKKFNLPVWTTKEVHSGIDKNYCVRCKLLHQNRRYVEKNVTFELGDFSITPFGVPHDSTDNIGYVVRHEGVVFTLLTDVGHITDEMKGVIRDSDYLVIEANYSPEMLATGPYPLYLQNRISGGRGHLSNQQCGEAIANNCSRKLKHVWLCHLSEENNRPNIAYDCVKNILENNGIRIGHDLMLDVLNRKRPTGIFHLE